MERRRNVELGTVLPGAPRFVDSSAMRTDAAAFVTILLVLATGCSEPDDGSRDGGASDGAARDAAAMDAAANDAGAVDGSLACIAPEGPLPFAGCNPERGIECDGDWRGPNARTGSEFCTPACGADQCCSPQRGRFECVPRDASGACPAADLFPDADRITGEYYVQYRNFAPDDCAIAEGCVGGPGVRRLLRFDLWTPNTGGADMFLGQTPRAGMSTDRYEWSSCHGHFHFNTYAEYELLTSDETCVAAPGHKQAFCLLDFYRYPGRDETGAVYDCSYQGIQRDWQDVYSSSLDCQWVDVTDVAPGDYVLRIRINTEHQLYESDYANNEIRVPVTIPAEPPDVDVTAPCTRGEEGADRDCGWTREGVHDCTPGAVMAIGCSAACGFGSCTGDTVMRVCDVDHDPTCTARWLIGQNDDSQCGAGACGSGGDCCSRAEFQCPASGQYVVFTGAYAPGDAASCTVAVGPSPMP